VGTPLVSGYRGHPPRSCLVCAERGNPVGVRAVVGPGRPIARGAELRRRDGMPNKRMPVRRKATGTRGEDAAAPGGSRGVTGRMPTWRLGPKGR
jgi:hypothetical protein